MISSQKDIAVNIKVCMKCLDSCNDDACQVCIPCHINETTQILHQAYREHQGRGEFHRLFPTERYLQPSLFKYLSMKNRALLKWFIAKCEMNHEWC